MCLVFVEKLCIGIHVELISDAPIIKVDLATPRHSACAKIEALLGASHTVPSTADRLAILVDGVHAIQFWVQLDQKFRH